MYEQHASMVTPTDDTIIWRYMNLEKLVALLCDRSLFMCRLDNLRDPWEGVWPKPVLDAMRPHMPDKVTKSFLLTTEMLRAAFYVNCWHAGEHESAALWDSYAGRAGLAMRSTVGRLKSAIKEEKSVYIGQVRYCDYSQYAASREFSAITPGFLKRRSFEHEREVRAVIWQFPDYDTPRGTLDWSKAQPSLSATVDLTALIDSIYLSPTAPAWLVGYIQELLRRFDLPSIEVQKSDLYSKCVY